MSAIGHPSTRLVRLLLRPELTALGGLLLAIVAFSASSSEFLTTDTFASITTFSSELGIVAIGVTLLMIGGHFDLSVGAMVGLTSYSVAFLINDAGAAPLVAAAGGVLFGGLLGLVNGLIQARTQLNSFIVTLGTALVFKGVLTARTSGFPITVELPDGLSNVLAGQFAGSFRTSLLWFLALAAIGSVVLLRTRFGNWVYASGENRAAAQNLGVPTARVSIALFAISGLCAGLVGVIDAARFGSVDANRGVGMELTAITVAVIGGTLLTGGYGSIVGSLVGALLFGVVQVGLVVNGLASYYFEAFVGIALLLTALISRTLNARAELALRAPGAPPGASDPPEPESGRPAAEQEARA